MEYGTVCVNFCTNSCTGCHIVGRNSLHGFGCEHLFSSSMCAMYADTHRCESPKAKEACPRTCGACLTAVPTPAPTVASTAVPTSWPTSSCWDNDAAAKNLSNNWLSGCAMVRSMCKDSKVGLQVSKYCPKTCGVCESDFAPLTDYGDRSIRTAVGLWFSNRTAAISEY